MYFLCGFGSSDDDFEIVGSNIPKDGEVLKNLKFAKEQLEELNKCTKNEEKEKIWKILISNGYKIVQSPYRICPLGAQLSGLLIDFEFLFFVVFVVFVVFV